MTPTPHSGLDHPTAPPPHLAIEIPRLRALSDADRELCFAVEGSPPGSGRSRRTAEGLCLEHELEGVVVCVTPTHLDLGSGVGLVRVRYCLPSAIRLDRLLGHRVALRTEQRLGDRGGFDLRLRDANGALVLWAFDGCVPGGDEALGARWDGELRLRSASGEAPAPDRLGAVRLEGRAFRCLTLRASADEASFVVLA